VFENKSLYFAKKWGWGRLKRAFLLQAQICFFIVNKFQIFPVECVHGIYRDPTPFTLWCVGSFFTLEYVKLHNSVFNSIQAKKILVNYRWLRQLLGSLPNPWGHPHGLNITTSHTKQVKIPFLDILSIRVYCLRT